MAAEIRSTETAPPSVETGVALPLPQPLSLAPPGPNRQATEMTMPHLRVQPREGESERLARRLAVGERAAFEQLYRRHGATTFAYLRSQLRNRAGAEDVQQQVWLEVWERRSSFDPARASFLTWVMLITRSRAIDHQRRRQPEPRDPQLDLDPLGGVEEARTDELLERWRVADALQRLPHEEAEMLRMRFQDQLTQPEIAERTGVALGTVKMRMVDGLARLRDLLAEEERG
jgi:RNA polymerase sigma-70 factor (ECF subfamily)